MNTATMLTTDISGFLTTLDLEVFEPLTSASDLPMPISAVSDVVLHMALTTFVRKGLSVRARWRVSVGVLSRNL